MENSTSNDRDSLEYGQKTKKKNDQLKRYDQWKVCDTFNEEEAAIYYMYFFRTDCCQLFDTHKCGNIYPYDCHFYHLRRNKRRKPTSSKHNPNKFSYSPELCVFKSIENCPKREECQNSHILQREDVFHPQLYKTRFCSHQLDDDTGFCKIRGSLCPHAHNKKELRRPSVYPLLKIQQNIILAKKSRFSEENLKANIYHKISALTKQNETSDLKGSKNRDKKILSDIKSQTGIIKETSNTCNMKILFPYKAKHIYENRKYIKCFPNKRKNITKSKSDMKYNSFSDQSDKENTPNKNKRQSPPEIASKSRKSPCQKHYADDNEKTHEKYNIGNAFITNLTENESNANNFKKDLENYPKDISYFTTNCDLDNVSKISSFPQRLKVLTQEDKQSNVWDMFYSKSHFGPSILYEAQKLITDNCKKMDQSKNTECDTLEEITDFYTSMSTSDFEVDNKNVEFPYYYLPEKLFQNQSEYSPDHSMSENISQNKIQNIRSSLEFDHQTNENAESHFVNKYETMSM